MMLYSCRGHVVKLASLADRYIFTPENFKPYTYFALIFRGYCNFSTSRLTDNSAAYFKNRNLIPFLKDVFDEKVASSIPHFRNSQEKKAHILNFIELFNTTTSNITSLKELQNDASGTDDIDFCKSVQQEILLLENKLGDIENAILEEILINEEEKITDVIFEVTAGVGGQEAMLFAQELHNLYQNYLNFHNWQFEIANFEETEIGGIRQSSMLVSGRNSFKILSIEAGIHRVQRIPATEKGSRLHTSTVSITVYPQPSEVDIVIPASDLRIETKTARGPGGQHVNKIQTAVRIHHLPTGLIVDCQVHKSQTQNRTIAMQKLRSKLFQRECEKRDSKVESVRKFQMGTRARNEKIRTYNYLQDRITDHRYHISCNNVERYLDGGSYFHNFIEQLYEAHSRKRKEEFLEAIQVANR